jgi:hypothetical protein
MTLIEKTEKKILSRKPLTIKLANENIFPHSTASEFVKEYFKHYRPATIQVNRKLETICRPLANRSILDLYKLTKHYYPDFTLKELLSILELLLRDGKIFAFKCYQVNRLVFYTSHGYGNYEDSLSDEDEPIGVGLPSYLDLIEELEQ